jgi:hypothetical protein
MSVTYLDAFLEGGIANPNFFNGRVLTAQDLRDAQRADRERVQRLGQVLEPGVAAGLMVGASGASLTVTAGLALSRTGATLLLPRDVVLPLVGEAPSSAGQDSPFAPCSPEDPTLVGNVVSGFYLLAIAAATGLSAARAPTTSLNGGDVACAARFELDGVQLKLVSIPSVLDDGTAWQDGAETLWRSRLAAACFGLPILDKLAPDPFAVPDRYGLADQLRANGSLLECDVPLAVLRWLGQSVASIDLWAVRRACVPVAGLGAYPPPTAPGVGGETFPQHASNRREVEARALLLQFQTQLEELRKSLSTPAQAAGTSHFAYLPAAGYLPLAAAGRAGFTAATFFGLEDAPPPTELDPAYLRDLIHRSFFVDPIPFGADPPIDLFTVPGTDPARPYVVFARRQRLPAIVEPPSPADPEPEPEPTPDDQPPEPPRRPATLIAIVTDAQGRTVTVDQIDEIVATTRGRSFPPEVYEQHGRFDWNLGLKVKQAIAETERTARASGRSGTSEAAAMASERRSEAGVARATSSGAATTRSSGTLIMSTSAGQGWTRADLAVEPRFKLGTGLTDKRPAVFIFHPLPAPADYVVRVVAERGRIVKSSAIHLEPGDTHTLKIALVRYEAPPEAIPGRVRPGDAVALPGGWAIDHFYVDPRWDRVPTRPDEQWTDPPPDWLVTLPSDAVDAFAGEFENWAANDPGLAAGSPTLYVRPDYSPTESYGEPYAFVRTAEGRYWPTILVPGENAAGIDLPPARAGLADLDLAADAALQSAGLPTLDATAGAWTSLLGAALGLQEAGATSLQAETREVASSFQSGFLGFPGMTQEANAALIAAFGDRTGLANATSEQVRAALANAAGQFSQGFVSRLIDRARGSVEVSSWSTDRLDLGDNQRDALQGMGVETVGGLLARAETAEGRSALQQALNLDGPSLDRVLDEAAANQAAGRLTQQPERGVAALPGMTPDRARQLVGMGLGTEGKLAAADRQTVATALDLSLDEVGSLQSGAVESGRAALAIENLPGVSAAQADALRAQGIASIGDLLAADQSRVTGALGNNAALAGRIRDSAGTIATRIGTTARGFR